MKQITVMLTGLIMAATMNSAFAKGDDLQTLKNMERERANLIQNYFDNSIDADKRRASLEAKSRRLVDLERMVMRDSRLEGNTDVLVRRAFNDYDLTFLAHASAEHNTSLIGYWIDNVGLSHENIMSATRGIR